MRISVRLDDNLLQTARELSGLTDASSLLTEALNSLIHQETSRRLAALGGTMPDLEHVSQFKGNKP